MDQVITISDLIQFIAIGMTLLGGWWKISSMQRAKEREVKEDNIRRQGEIIEETKRRTTVEQQIKNIQSRLDLADAADLETRKDISTTLKSMDKKLGNIEGRLIHLESAERLRTNQ